jgi:cysteine desulfurase family protein
VCRIVDIYLDNAATSYPKPEAVYQAVERFMREGGGSPGRSGHRRAREADRVVRETRAALARLFNVADPQRIVFAPNATEAINLALKGLLKPGDHAVASGMEHNAVRRPLAHLEEKGVEVTFVPCAEDGTLKAEEVAAACQSNTRLLAVNHASNVVGTITPVTEIGAMAHQKGIPLLVDAAQTAGAYPLDVQEAGIDLLAFSGHKGLLGPQGTGGLYIGPELEPLPLKEGGTGRHSEVERQPDLWPDKYESGTLNAVGLAGLGAGVRFLQEVEVEAIRAHEEQLTAYLLERLDSIPGLVVHGTGDPSRQVGVVSLSIEGQDPLEIAYVLDEVYGVMVRAGLHCAPLAHRTIGTFPQGTVRLSLSYFNTVEEVDHVSECLAQIAGNAYA